MNNKVTGVFWWSVFVTLAVVIWGAVAPDNFGSIIGNVRSFLTSDFGWYYLLIVSLFLIICIALGLSKYGRIKLGSPDSKPDYSTPTWFAMLFSAGMGTGLVFWGAAEPISHFMTSTPEGVETGTNEAARDALRYTFFHWGLHAWGIYGIVALALAYFKFRHGKPGLISATLSPILGKKAEGPIGKIIDIIAIFATVVGVATTLGLGAIQINGGLSFLTGISKSFGTQVIIIVIVTILFMISAWSGLSKGIKILSNANLGLATLLLLVVLFAGPTVYILNMFVDTLGSYIQNLPRMSFRLSPLNEENRGWIDSWTIYYWAWWIAWSPFVGLFIARVSKGRSIREFVFGVLFVPAIVSMLWFAVFGTSAIDVQQKGLATLQNLPTENVLFGTLQQFPLGTIAIIVGLCLIGTFFITSADSATFVLGMQSTNGSLNPSGNVKLTWGFLQAAVALVLLYSGGETALTNLQNMLILAAFPFSIIMILMTASLIKALGKDYKQVKQGNKTKKVS
ncbi:BCCT family transporter [Priestia filamentosa]|uniref:glycine betaine uptake BCCT transporter n=1 Tax=Priestia filamentosa TaxID=1402861 RepID=UPI001FB4DA9E|nr:BCCT family transporter [Priestia filamentosa]MED3726194.1 BCCT family transporter [Priestia filamentosa]UOE59354.1 BCCT family transporter [Priestia filamentosa]